MSKDLRTPSFQHPLVENLTIITKLKLSLRYAILSDIDYKQIFQLYSPQLELIPDLCNWYLQLLILEKYKFDQEKSTEIFVMMIFLILKYMRSNLDSALLKYDIVESIIRKEVLQYIYIIYINSKYHKNALVLGVPHQKKWIYH